MGGVMDGEAQMERARSDFYIWGNCCLCDSITSARLPRTVVVVMADGFDEI